MLGCIQPISSPMMKRMLGFCCCCADAVPATVTVAKNVSTASQTILVMLMVAPTILSKVLRRPTACVQLSTDASMTHEAVIHGNWELYAALTSNYPTIQKSGSGQTRLGPCRLNVRFARKRTR